ncbi:very short patch repair endonuclease [Candidatus Hydrogenedentota bacterium]
MFSKEDRSEIMRRVHSTNTRPEIRVRSFLHRLGYRFRIHRKDLPGNPDIVLPKYGVVIFVHGCFWHRHKNCRRATTPSSQQDYWLTKFDKTVERDKRTKKALKRLGWTVLVVWECETKNLTRFERCLVDAISRLQPSK